MMRKIVTSYVIEANFAFASIKIDYYNTKVHGANRNGCSTKDTIRCE